MNVGIALMALTGVCSLVGILTMVVGGEFGPVFFFLVTLATTWAALLVREVRKRKR